MSQKPWLSVIIPTYNGGKYLATALNSVVAQQDKSIECIVIDDGSTDDTLAIAQSFNKQINLSIITPTRTGNWVANTNYALTAAKGKYACFLHQDDLWLEGRLNQIRKAIAAYPQASLHIHDSMFVNEEGKPLGLWRCPLPNKRGIITKEEAIDKLIVQNFVAIPAPVFKCSAALEIGKLDEELWYTADWDFWLKLAASGDTCYIPQALAAFRVHPDSQTIRRSSSVAEFRQQMRTVVDKHLANCANREVGKVALFSTEVNTTLAAMVHGESPNLSKLALDFLLLSPTGWWRYWQDSRIQERVSARLKAKLQTQG